MTVAPLGTRVMSDGSGFRFIVKRASLVLDDASNLLKGLVNLCAFWKHPDNVGVLPETNPTLLSAIAPGGSVGLESKV